LDIFGSVCQTTAYAHSSNFIHRDLKPANVMVGTFGEVQVMDWGLAKKLSSSDGEMFDTAINGNGSDFKFTLPGATQVGDVFGTPAYMSPEQVRGEESDKRSDVFTLGGILFQILTGKAPFPRGRSKKKTGVTEEALAQLDQVEADAELLALLRSCLAEDPADRPLDAQQVSQRFANFLAGRAAQFEEAKLEKARATERLIAQQKRNKQLLWSGGVVLATVIASAVAGYMYLAEKNVRIADQARVETENIERKFNHESQIRSNIDAAKVYSLAAVQNPLHQRHTDWTLALKEVEKAVPLVSESIDPELRTEFLEFERSVRSETAFALRNKKHHDEEAACAKELFPLREHVFYPEDMRLCKMVYLAPQFEAVFKRLGVEPGVFSRDAISRITGSEFKIELIHGLMSWQQETELFLVYNDLHIYDTPELSPAENRRSSGIAADSLFSR